MMEIFVKHYLFIYFGSKGLFIAYTSGFWGMKLVFTNL